MTYKVQIDDEIRDATAEEIEVIKGRQAEKIAQDEALADKANAKAAIAERLGLTDAELVTLLG